VYRIFSELLNNTIKHAGASEVELHLSIENENINAAYQDNGSGINFDKFQSGLGVQSIENRVDYLNGYWKYGNRQTSGFYAKFIIPLVKPTITETS
jgi:signal transduction histidine kinase